MSDIVERARTAITTIGYAQMHGVGNAYPDSVIARLLAELVAEVERLRPRRIENVEELDALPEQSVVQNELFGVVFEKVIQTGGAESWWSPGGLREPTVMLPARLLWTPEAQ